MPTDISRRARTATRAVGALPLAALPLAALLAGGALPGGLAAQVLVPAATHVYRVDGSLVDERGGPSLVALGGTWAPRATRSAPARGSR
jgi:hypothetical protein